MNGYEFSIISLFKAIVSKYQVDSKYTITLLLGKLTTGMPDLMASFEIKIDNFENRFTSLEHQFLHVGRSRENLDAYICNLP